MARKPIRSPLEDVVEVTARLPWWVGAALAVASYALFHYFATRQIAAPIDPHHLGEALPGQVWKGIARTAQYVVPLAFLIGAVVSLLARQRRAELVQRVASGRDAAVLNAMTWQEFEALVGEGFRLKGYAVLERGGNAADGGVDLVLAKGAERALVQCKQWRATKVPVQTVRELYGVMAAEGAARGFVVTSGRFTSAARRFARGRNIELLDGATLFALFDDVRSAVAAAPSCPKCAKTMVRRIAQQGSNAGKPFWGCAAFPECRGIRPIQ